MCMWKIAVRQYGSDLNNSLFFPDGISVCGCHCVVRNLLRTFSSSVWRTDVCINAKGFRVERIFHNPTLSILLFSILSSQSRMVGSLFGRQKAVTHFSWQHELMAHALDLLKFTTWQSDRNQRKQQISKAQSAGENLICDVPGTKPRNGVPNDLQISRDERGPKPKQSSKLLVQKCSSPPKCKQFPSLFHR